jgi:hypothetical protein
MEVLKGKCVHCGKIIFSLYQDQLTYNVKAHEMSCPRREIDKDSKKKVKIT